MAAAALSSARADEIAAWVRLEQTSGVGPETARKLLAAFGPPEQLFSLSFSTLQKTVSERIARALTAAPSDATLAQIDKTLQWLAQPDNHLLTLADPGYPAALFDIPDPPLSRAFTIMVSDVPGPTGGIIIKTLTGALISVNDTVGITISNGKGASILMTGASVIINAGALVMWQNRGAL